GGQKGDVRLDRLRVAFFTDNGLLTPVPAIQRAVREAAVALRADVAAVDEWRPPDLDEAWEIYLAVLFADGGVHARRALARSRQDPRVRQLVMSMAAPHGLLKAAAPFVRLLGQKRFATG